MTALSPKALASADHGMESFGFRSGAESPHVLAKIRSRIVQDEPLENKEWQLIAQLVADAYANTPPPYDALLFADVVDTVAILCQACEESDPDSYKAGLADYIEHFATPNCDAAWKHFFSLTQHLRTKVTVEDTHNLEHVIHLLMIHVLNISKDFSTQLALQPYTKSLFTVAMSAVNTNDKRISFDASDLETKPYHHGWFTLLLTMEPSSFVARFTSERHGTSTDLTFRELERFVTLASEISTDDTRLPIGQSHFNFLQSEVSDIAALVRQYREDENIQFLRRSASLLFGRI